MAFQLLHVGVVYEVVLRRVLKRACGGTGPVQNTSEGREVEVDTSSIIL